MARQVPTAYQIRLDSNIWETVLRITNLRVEMWGDGKEAMELKETVV
jgi:hypothetical protein